jgi:hypothetical protein
MAGEYRLPAFYGYEGGEPGAWWVIRWDEALFTFVAEALVDHSGELPCPEGSADVEDCYDPDEGPVAVLGRRPAELGEVADLEAAMRWEDELVRIPAGMAADLQAVRDRFLATLRPDEVQARVDAAWQASEERSERLRALQLQATAVLRGFGGLPPVSAAGAVRGAPPDSGARRVVVPKLEKKAAGTSS